MRTFKTGSPAFADDFKLGGVRCTAALAAEGDAGRYTEPTATAIVLATFVLLAIAFVLAAPPTTDTDVDGYAGQRTPGGLVLRVIFLSSLLFLGSLSAG